MLQIHLSQEAASMLPELVTDIGEIELKAMQWYGHRIEVMEGSCLILMERNSRYAILFSGLSESDYGQFPELFYRRLWREVMSICRPDEQQADGLQAVIDNTMARQQYRCGGDRMMREQIDTIGGQFIELVKRIGHPPRDTKEEFLFGMKVNDQPRQTSPERDYFLPRERFRELWLERLGCGPESAANPSQGESADNVVPFPRR